jgi:fructokinase
MKEPHLILGIGELLWDMLPTGPRLGGAPANFTVMAARLGNHAAILSRIGRDGLGRAAIEALDPLPADISRIQIDPAHPTGQVNVTFADGQPSYEFPEPSAWDALELSSEWVQLAERADAICFGSLAQRSLESRQTIQTLAAQTSSACVRVLDVNLRAPFYSGEAIQESLELATVAKMNDAEVPYVLTLLGLPDDDLENPDGLRLAADRLLAEFPTLRMIAITRGGSGSLLVTREEWHAHPGIPTTVVDTVGAGDAFTAALTHYLLRGASLPVLNEAGNRWGSWVASQAGAMPPLTQPAQSALQSAIESISA